MDDREARGGGDVQEEDGGVQTGVGDDEDDELSTPERET